MRPLIRLAPRKAPSGFAPVWTGSRGGHDKHMHGPFQPATPSPVNLGDCKGGEACSSITPLSRLTKRPSSPLAGKDARLSRWPLDVERAGETRETLPGLGVDSLTQRVEVCFARFQSWISLGGSACFPISLSLSSGATFFLSVCTGSLTWVVGDQPPRSVTRSLCRVEKSFVPRAWSTTTPV